MQCLKLVRGIGRGAILCTLVCTLERRGAASMTVYGSPGYTPGVGGYVASKGFVDGANFSVDVNNAGVAIARARRYDGHRPKELAVSGSRQAGPRAAVLFTILAGAKRHRIEPWAYLREILLRSHADDPRVDEMLPDRWAAERRRVLQPRAETPCEPSCQLQRDTLPNDCD